MGLLESSAARYLDEEVKKEVTMATNDANVLTDKGARALVERMGEAASDFLASLATDQRAKAVFDFVDEEERTGWYYTPTERRGLPLVEMDRRQQRLAHTLVATGLSRAGYVTASTIMGLETTLDALEGWRWPGRGRDPALYHVSIFGEISPKEPWGWRFEGHHISLNYTIVEGRIIAPTPTFFGANPAEAGLGAVGTLRPLAGVEDLARELLRTLSEEQRLAVVISPAAPSDIVTGNRPKVEEGALPLPSEILRGLPFTDAGRERFERRQKELGLTEQYLDALRFSSAPKGLPASTMNAAQHEVLTALIRQYIDRMPEEIAEIEIEKLRRHGFEGVHFAWAGGLERRQPNYYRLQAPRFLVEYDNTQNDANHIHSVWRDPINDFGANLLARHYARSHNP